MKAVRIILTAFLCVKQIIIFLNFAVQKFFVYTLI